MTQLLQPRYKCIARDLTDLFKVGEIIWFMYDGQMLTRNYGDGSFNYTAEFLDEFPHLFRRLEWWEDREEGQIPKYVKWRDIVGIGSGTEMEYEMHLPNGNSIVMHISNYLPATEEEYLNQKK